LFLFKTFDIVGVHPMLILLCHKIGAFFNVDLTLRLIVTNYDVLISMPFSLTPHPKSFSLK